MGIPMAQFVRNKSGNFGGSRQSPSYFGTRGAVLENFEQILEKLLLKNAIKVRIPLVKRPENGVLEGSKSFKKNFDFYPPIIANFGGKFAPPPPNN